MLEQQASSRSRAISYRNGARRPPVWCGSRRTAPTFSTSRRAGLQLTSLKANHGSATRTQAVYLTYDIIDRMRANRQAAMDGAYNIAVDADPAAGTVAGDDLVAWRQNISNALPVGHSQPSGSV